MSRRKKAVAGSRRPEIGPEVRISVVGGLAQRMIGAATYLAILAYPAPKEWRKREKFVDAVRVWLSKQIMEPHYPRLRMKEKYRHFKPSQAKVIMGHAFWRIGSRRLRAVQMLAGMVGEGWEHGSCKFLLADPGDSMKEDIKNWDRARGIKKAALWIAGPGGRTERINCPDRSRNIKQRIWAESLPVLHLASVLPSGANGRGLILNPVWVSEALQKAELLREILLPLLRRSARVGIRILAAS
jgi:hypothetical protein